MPENQHLTAEGESSLAYQLFRTGLKGEILEKLAEADTQEALWKIHTRRLDYHYAILHRRKQIWPVKE
jgi:hypothetical protein